jgi:hypothetical protein
MEELEDNILGKTQKRDFDRTWAFQMSNTILGEHMREKPSWKEQREIDLITAA